MLGLRRPLGGLPRLDPTPGTVAVVAVMIGTVTFDGLCQGPLWRDLQSGVIDTLDSLGIGDADRGQDRQVARAAARA